ncbi:MAG: beta strand repeat-containing protein [Coraliomargaritaceae bacterium]
MKTLTSLKRYFALPLVLCLGLTAQAQTVFFTEDFETDGQGTRYTATTPFSSGTQDHWNRTDGTNISNVSGAYSSFSGTYFWATEDTDYSTGTGDDVQTIDITGIDIAGQTDLQFQALFGAGNENGVGSSKYDNVDYIKVEAQIDGGGYNDVIWFSYLARDGDTSNEPFGVDRDFDGSADSATDLLGTALQSYSANISGTGITLDIRISVHMEFGSEEVAFDNIQILGSVSGDEAITLSSAATTVDEGSTLAVTLSVPTVVDSDTVFNLTSGGDGSELSIPATATILAGANSVNFDVSGLSDSELDGDIAVTITAASTGYTSTSLDITVVDTDIGITLSATSATVDEGSTLAVTLSVPTNVDSDTVFNLTRGGDGSELSIPATATILAGTNSVNFDVSGLSDSEYDIDTTVTITAASTGYVSSSLDITVVDTDFASLTAILTEDFETDGQGSRYTASTPFNNGSSDHFNRTDGSDISNTTGAYSSFSGTYFWAAEDTDDNGGDGVDEKTLDITGINILGATDLQFKALFGAGNENGVGASNYDSTDYIKVQAQIDGGGYSEVLWFSFLDPGGSDNDNEPFGVDRDFDGAADSADDLLGTALQSYTASISGTGSTLDLRIQVHMDIGNEEIAFDNIQILGAVSDDEAITLSSAASTVDEGSTLAVTLSVPTNVDTDTVFNLTSGGDGSELSIPDTATILAGANSVNFDVSGLSDSEYDVDTAVTITAASTGYISSSLNVSVVNTDSRPPMGDIIFTQYYEPSSGSDKWLEITNVGDSPVDISSYEIALWSTTGTEDWKTDGGTPYKTHSFTGVTLAAGESYIITAPYGSTSHYSYTLSDVTSEITFFNGDDSLVLYSDPAGYLTSNVLDAISFTDAGDEGKDKGFVRASASYGFDFNSGSSIEDYPAIWTEIANTTADAAVDGDDAYAGSTALVASAADPVADYLTARSLTSSDLATDSNGNGFTVLEEYLAGFGDGSGPDAISYGIDNDALTLTSDSESEPSGITVVLQATSDLSVAFENVAFTASVGDVNDDGTYTRSYTETSPPAGGQRFLRLSITTD